MSTNTSPVPISNASMAAATEAAKKQEGTYTCGTGPDTLKKPCCSCYSRPRGAKAELCAPRIADYRRGFDKSSFVGNVWCVKQHATSKINALDNQANHRFVKQKNIDDGPYNEKNCKYIFGPGIGLQDVTNMCQDHKSNVYCKLKIRNRKVYSYYELVDDNPASIDDYTGVQNGVDKETTWKSLKHDTDDLTDTFEAGSTWSGEIFTDSRTPSTVLDIDETLDVGSVIRLDSFENLYSCESDHQGDKYLKQEGDLFFSHIPLAAAVEKYTDGDEEGLCGGSNNTCSTYTSSTTCTGNNCVWIQDSYLQFTTQAPHNFYFQDRVEFNNIFVDDDESESPIPQIDIVVRNVLDPYTFLTLTRTGITLAPRLNGKPQFVSREQEYTTQTHYRKWGKINVLLFFRKVLESLDPVPGLHRIEEADLRHVRNEFNGVDYRRHVKRGWEVQIVDEDSGLTQVFVVSSTGLLSENAFVRKSLKSRRLVRMVDR